MKFDDITDELKERVYNSNYIELAENKFFGLRSTQYIKIVGDYLSPYWLDAYSWPKIQWKKAKEYSKNIN